MINSDIQPRKYPFFSSRKPKCIFFLLKLIKFFSALVFNNRMLESSANFNYLKLSFKIPIGELKKKKILCCESNRKQNARSS